MIKYDDFAMPSLENIENMAKSYADMERKIKESDKNTNKCDCENERMQKVKKRAEKEDYALIDNLYECIYQSYNIVCNLFNVYPKNRKFFILSEMLAKIKVDYESDFIDYNLKLPNNKYSFSESTVAYDLIKSWCKVCKLCICNIKNEELKNKYLSYFIDLIAEIVKY